MLGPEANHFVLVSHADHFRWRDGAFGDLIPLLGDGMLTIDGDFHRRSRRIMLPGVPPRADRRGARAIAAEVERAVAPLARRRAPGPLPLGARARAARRAAGAVRARSRSPPARARPRRGVRARALLLRARVRAADPARPAHAVRGDDGRPPPARRAALRRDRAPPAQRRARGGPAQPAARRARRGRLGAQRGARARPPDDDAVRRPRHDDGHRGVPVLRARPRARVGRAPGRRARRARRASPTPPT